MSHTRGTNEGRQAETDIQRAGGLLFFVRGRGRGRAVAVAVAVAVAMAMAMAVAGRVAGVGCPGGRVGRVAGWLGGPVAGWPGGRGWWPWLVAGAWPGGRVARWPGGQVAGWPGGWPVGRGLGGCLPSACIPSSLSFRAFRGIYPYTSALSIHAGQEQSSKPGRQKKSK